MTILAYYFNNGRRIDLTDEDYFRYLKLKEPKNRKTQIADLIFYRLYGRYLKPFQFPNPTYKKEFKNGFSMMANGCLLIETLESFLNGWGDTKDKIKVVDIHRKYIPKDENRKKISKSELAFWYFFSDYKYFLSLKNYRKDFYKNIRCGILHQGETTGGWKIKRPKDKKLKELFDPESLTINANVFAKEIEKVLKKYVGTLNAEKWDSEVWYNCQTKMNKIIENCK